jgi:CHAD domain-containing protein
MVNEGKTEVEAKYQIRTPGAGDRYLVAPELGPFMPLGSVRTIRIEDHYVDTAGWALARAGFAARLRHNRGVTLELKRQATPEGRLHRREELSGPADPKTPPSEWPASAARSVVIEMCGDEPLVELFTIVQSRDCRKLECGETKATLSVDQVEILAAGRQIEKFAELETELDAGPEEPLSALADLLDQDAHLKRSSRSKYDRGVRAVRKLMPGLSDEARDLWSRAPSELAGHGRGAGRGNGHTQPDGADVPEPAKQAGRDIEIESRDQGSKPGPRSIGVLADDTLPEAACKVLQFHFNKLRTKEKGTRSGTDPEDLHQMRVAARRMRSAWRVFDGAFKPAKTRKLRRSLRILSFRLGTVRDLDVLIEGLEAYQAGLDPAQRPGLETLLLLWRRQRGTARQLLLDELDSARYAHFVSDMQSFIEAGANEASTVPTPTSPHRIRDRVPSQIWADYEAVRVYDLVLPWADIETVHELRIASKWLRYDLEFFGETLGRDAERLTDRVVALQDFLGCLHDADVAAKLARDVLVARAGELTPQERDAIGAFLHSREREVGRRRRALGPVWRAITGAPFRRALGRATASL